MTNYVVATVKEWNISQYKNEIDNLPGHWHLITHKSDLNVEKLAKIKPKYIFFPHWSWIVPPEILSRWECVCFHMADVPYGRGGSPLQNLIVRGHKETKLTALRMTEELDAGPVYKKVELSLDGSAQEIFERMAPKVYDLVRSIIKSNITPEEQKGSPTVFARRKPEQSLIPQEINLEQLYDHIRMLDADTYPKASITHGDLHIEFSDAKQGENESLEAKVHITLNKK